MGTQRERIAAYRDAVASAGAKEIRMPFVTLDALVLVTELEESEMRHGEALGQAALAVQQLGPAPKQDSEAMIVWGANFAKAADRFWDAFEGQVVDGVEIIRRRT